MAANEIHKGDIGTTFQTTIYKVVNGVTSVLDLTGQIKAKLMLAQIAVGLGKLNMPNFDLKKGNQYINEVSAYIEAKKAGYVTIIAGKA